MRRPAGWVLGAALLTACGDGSTARPDDGSVPDLDADADAGGPPGPLPRGSRRVRFPSDGLELRGTFELPERDPEARGPALVLVHGSGPQSRDQPVPGQLNLAFGFELPVFRQLADRLASAGVAVLRYDKRTCGPFNGCADNDYPPPSPNLTAETFITDVEAALDFLGAQPEVDPDRIFVVGHSQGASFVPSLVARRSDVRAGVMLAGPHRSIDALLAYQLDFSRQLGREAGIPESELDVALADLIELVADLRALRDGAHDGSPIGGAPVRFWRSWMDIGDAAPGLVASLDRPLLALGGGYDWNVPPSEIARWATTFQAASDPGHAAETLECVTHALNCISQPEPSRIRPGDIGRGVHPPVVERMVRFFDGL